MNTYNDNLLQTVDDTLSALNDEQVKLSSAQLTAQYNLYYAQGAEITARDKLSVTNDKVAFYGNVNSQGVINDNQINNALASATQANTNVATSITNVATAASNVQIASNAVALLASDIGAALNIATASLYNSDMYGRIKSANGLINETANDAKAVSLKSMEAAGSTSSIIAPTVLNNASATKTKVENLLALTENEFNKYANLAVTENANVSSASKNEHSAEGALCDANEELAAITQAYSNANTQLNLNLAVTVQSSTQITLSFNKISEGLFSTPEAQAAKIPPMKPIYYATLVTSDQSSLLTTEQAEQLFSQQPEQQQTTPGKSVTVTSPFTQVSPGTTVLTLTDDSRDVFGEKVTAGQQYVIFIYAVIDLKYKQYTSNFNDLLSAPSQTFVPATNLPEAKPVTGTKPGKASQNDRVTVSFCAEQVPLPDIPGETASVEYRCIFVRSTLDPARNFMVNDDYKDSPIYFDADIAQQLGSSNYLVANKRSRKNGDNDNEEASKTSNQRSLDTYSVEVERDTTDNFGNPLIAGQTYKPYILAVIDGDKDIANRFVPTLSAQLADMVPNPAPQGGDSPSTHASANNTSTSSTSTSSTSTNNTPATSAQATKNSSPKETK